MAKGDKHILMHSPLHSRARHSSAVMLLFLLAALLSACAGKAPDIPASGQHGAPQAPFVSRWWGYYQRGLSFALQGAYRQAIKDFQLAIDKKEHDQWQAEIPGETIIDYFPHREIGVLHYLQREYSLAIPELEQSIRTAPSAKGYFYLNKAKGAKLRRDSSDDIPPEIVIEGRINKKILEKNCTHAITGVVSDKSQLESVRVGSHTLPLKPAGRQQVFSIEVPLNEGNNDISIRATDVFGNTAEQHLEILCDRRGPLIEIMNWQEEQDHTAVFGIISDAGGLRSMVVNDQPWKMSGTSTAYNFRFTLLEEPLSINALDLTGNRTIALIADDKPIAGPHQEQSASMADSSVDSPPPEGIASEKDLPFIRVIAPPREDRAPPFFQIQEDASFSETYDDNILLTGFVDDASPIRSLSLNGEPLPIKNGRRIYFSSLQNLFEGNNLFLFTAVDDHGNQAVKELTITRKIRNINRIRARLSVAVLPLSYQGPDTSLAGLVHTGMIASFRSLDRFAIITPPETGTKKPDGEPASAFAPDSEESIRWEAGIRPDTFINCKITDSPEGLEIVARLVDSKTGTILATHDIYTENKEPANLQPLLDFLAGRFKEDFPIVHGILSQVGENEVALNIGAEDGVQPNQLFICYRQGLEIRHPVTGKLVDAEPEIVAELRVTEVSAHSATAVVTEKHGPLRKYDRVIAR